MKQIKITNATKKGFIPINEGGVLDLSFPDSKTRRGRVIDDGNTSPTLDTGCEVGVVKEDREEISDMASQDEHGVLLDDGRMVRIRRLTPKECFRLQGWTDDYFEKAQFVNSDSQLYKQAGNGVTVNVIYEIAKRF